MPHYEREEFVANRIAATLALVAFAVCLLMGMQSDNTFSTVILRALAALVVTLIVGLVIGGMAQKMLDENLKAAKKSEIVEAKNERTDR